MNYWIGDTGISRLKGVVGEAGNPVQLTESMFIHIYTHVPKARAHYPAAYAALSPTEKAKMDSIFERNPFIATPPTLDRDRADAIQLKQARGKVWLPGPTGMRQV